MLSKVIICTMIVILIACLVVIFDAEIIIMSLLGVLFKKIQILVNKLKKKEK